MWFTLAPLAVADATGRQRIGLLPPFWVLLVFLLLAVGLAHARVTGKRGRGALALSLLILLPWLPLPVPDAFLIWSGPIVTFTWMTIAVRAIAARLPRIDGRVVRAFSEPHLAGRVACVLAFVVFVAVHYRQALPPVGDEPHYLVIAQSLVLDHDFEVSNNYERKDYLAYYGGPLRPHYARRAADGRLYSLHGPAVPLLIAPAFALGGYQAVILWLAAVGAVGMLFVWRSAYALTEDVTSAWFAWAAATLTAPAVLQVTLVYPDAVAGTVLAGALLALLTAQSLSTRGAILLGIGIGALPWLNARFALMAATLTVAVTLRVIAVQERRRALRTLLGLAPPLITSVAVLLMVSFQLYGTLNPLAAFDARVPLEWDRLMDRLVGLFADQEFGLVFNAPVHVLWIGGALTLWRHHRRVFVELACLSVPYVLALAAFPAWFGGGTTPARYLTPLALPLSVSIAAVRARQDPIGRSLSGALLIISALIAAAFAFGGTGSLAYNPGEGRAAVFDWLAPLVNLPGALPSYFRALPAEGPARGTVMRELMIPAAIWCSVAIACWSLARWIDRRPAVRAIGPAALAACCVASVVLVSVTLTWRFANVPHVNATRAQLALIAREGRPATPVGVQLQPLRLMAPADLLRRMEISTSPLEAASSAVPLTLSEVPPGEYRLRPRFASEPHGEIGLSIGRGGTPLTTWQLDSPDNAYTFPLPIVASTLTITADAAATPSIRSLALVPLRHLPDSYAGSTRARAAARYGETIVYAIDTRVVLDANGFWVLGERQPDVVMRADHSPPTLALELENVAIPNRIRISTGTWSESRDLAPGERWTVAVPYRPAGESATVNFSVARGVVVAGRMLGCHVRVVQ